MLMSQEGPRSTWRRTFQVCPSPNPLYVLTLGANGHSLNACKIAAHSSTVRARTGFFGSMDRVSSLSRRAAAPGATELRCDDAKINLYIRCQRNPIPQCFLDGTSCKYKCVPQDKIPRVYLVSFDRDLVEWFGDQSACYHGVSRALRAKSCTVEFGVTRSRIPVRIVW